MKIEPHSLRLRDPNLVVTPFKGQYDLSSSRGLALSDANALLEQAAVIIDDYRKMVGFGEVCLVCKQWRTAADDYATKYCKFIATGCDYQ